MCGINGFNFLDKKILSQMNCSLSHRGPDGEGTYFDKNVSLGHRRLAIIDLSKNANQPMSYVHKKRKAIITFNGELYNFLEIKKELAFLGYRFKTSSDTEVILASYMEWGFDCVKKFNGMWAFCIYDYNEKIFFLSRDRVGKKPLYYYFEDGKFIFSSEIKGILEHNFKLELDSDAVDLYFSLGFIPSPYSIYKKIRKLDQRESLVFNMNEKSISKNYYYDWPNFKPTKNKSKLRGDFNRLMMDSVRIRMISDVPLGTFLSGGLDSPTVAKYAKKFDKNLHTYSMGFEDEFDETPRIKIVKDKLDTNHHHKYFYEKDFNRILTNIFYYYDEPLSDSSIFSTYMLSKFAREKLTVALSGDGGDEIFGGYPRYKIAYQLMILKKIPSALRRMMMIFPYKNFQEGLRLSMLPKEKFYSESRSDFYKPHIYKNILEKKFSESLSKTGGNLVEAVRLMDIYFYTLPDNFLAKVDKASMANSLEVRSPFLDYRLIEYSMMISTKFKINLFSEKGFFRKIVSDFLPKKIVNSKKMGFTPPIQNWVNKENYLAGLKKMLKELQDAGIISNEWAKFYREKIFLNNTLIHNNYKIRLLLFYNWYNLWSKRINL